MDILNYKDYEGTAELDMERRVCRGKILFISDLITYEAASPADLQGEFEAAVDDYLETCKELGRDPQKPFKGQFNVRTPPALHKQAAMRALSDGISLNEVVIQALDAYINASDVNHHVETNNYYVTYDDQRYVASSNAISQEFWGGDHLRIATTGGRHVTTAH